MGQYRPSTVPRTHTWFRKQTTKCTFPKKRSAEGRKFSGQTFCRYHENGLQPNRFFNSKRLVTLRWGASREASAKCTRTHSRRFQKIVELPVSRTWTCEGLRYGQTWIEFEIKVLPLVHPNEGHPGEVRVEDFADAAFAGKSVRRRLPEDVPDVGAGCDLHAPAALPNLARFQVTSSDKVSWSDQIENHKPRL